MFHHFPDEPDVGADCLVASTDLTYRADPDDPDKGRRGQPAAALLASVTHRGYRRRPEREAICPGRFRRSSSTTTRWPFTTGSPTSTPTRSPSSRPGWRPRRAVGRPRRRRHRRDLVEQAGAWTYRANRGARTLRSARRPCPANPPGLR